jgi:hypothetical protein
VSSTDNLVLSMREKTSFRSSRSLIKVSAMSPIGRSVAVLFDDFGSFSISGEYCYMMHVIVYNQDILYIN